MQVHGVPVVDVAPLLDADADADGDGDGDGGGGAAALAAGRAVDAACRDVGFVSVVGHGVDAGLLARLDGHARAFFALPEDEKAAIAMPRAGRAWRGWFPLGGELTSGVPDLKEGLYFGAELPPDDPRVVAGTPLHGPNLFPARPAGLRDDVLAVMAAMERVGQALLRGMALALGLGPGWFADHLTGDPTVLFRIFRYPDGGAEAGGEDGGGERWGVGEHTDYGLVTVLAQDDRGGLQVRAPGGWVDVPPRPGSLVCNIGDMLERLTGGRYRSTPHRVRNVGGGDRLSFPFFLDPAWDAAVEPLPIAGPPPADAAARWDGASVHALTGTYGDYLTAKVAKVFPALAGTAAGPSAATGAGARSGAGR